MKIVNNTATTQAEPVTATYAIRGPINLDVCAGTPLGDAFNDLSTLLSTARDGLDFIATEGDGTTAAFSVLYILELAYAQVQAMHQGYIEHRKQIQG